MLAELTKTGTSWQEVKSIAQGRARWRFTVDALLPQGGERDLEEEEKVCPSRVFGM